MSVKHGTLRPVTAGQLLVSLTSLSILQADRSSQSLVIRIPAQVFDGTVLADRPGAETGSPIAVLTSMGEYRGFVEVVAEAPATNSRIYWCGVTKD